MLFRVWLVPGALFVLPAMTFGQQARPATNLPNLVQPGAPGQSTTVLSPAAAAISPRGPTEADTSFMQGMIMHHAQAVEMTDLMPTRTHNKELLALGKRISISQTDEIQYMKQWLEEHGKPASMDHGHMMNHGGMNMKGMDHASMGLMPGMLTPEQMRALAKATGKTFDRLFLTGMIQHHTGALIMVEDLFNTPGAGQDAVLFDFATDIDNTQRAEIDIMRNMLKEKR
jgi:uncharacterized protein (DUF305 family)